MKDYGVENDVKLSNIAFRSESGYYLNSSMKGIAFLLCIEQVVKKYLLLFHNLIDMRMECWT